MLLLVLIKATPPGCTMISLQVMHPSNTSAACVRNRSFLSEKFIISICISYSWGRHSPYSPNPPEEHSTELWSFQVLTGLFHIPTYRHINECSQTSPRNARSKS